MVITSYNAKSENTYLKYSPARSCILPMVNSVVAGDNPSSTGLLYSQMKSLVIHKNTNNKIYYLYLLINSIDNKPIYVGKGKGKRVKSHVNLSIKNLHYNKLLQRGIKKILKNDGHIIEKIIEQSNNENYIFKKEIEFIKLYGRRDKKTGCLYNLTDGGVSTSGYIVTDKTKNKLSNNKSRKKVVHIPTNTTYNSVREASIAHNIKYKVLCEQLRQNLIKCEFRYAWQKNVIRKYINYKSIIHIESGKIFDTIKNAALFFGIPEYYLGYKLRKGKSKDFRYADKNKTTTLGIKRPRIKIRHKKSGLIFNSILKASEKFNMPYSTIRTQLENNTPCKFEYFNECRT